MEPTTATSSNRSPRSGATTRQRLIDSGARQFNDVGYWGTDSNRIARAAGLSPGTFYRYFEHKKALLLAVYEEWVDAEWVRISDALTDMSRLSLRLVTQLVVEHHTKWGMLRQSLRALAAIDEEVAEFKIAQRRKQLEQMAGLLETVGNHRPSPERCLVVLVVFEQICDAIASEEVAQLGLDKLQLMEFLEDQLATIASESEGEQPQ